MPLITYAGQRVLIDNAYSLARVSTSGQGKDGEGLERQTRLSRAWAKKYGVPIDQELTVVGSAYKGYHIRRGKTLGPLGIFLDKAEKRLLKRNPVLLVESMSRLVRLATLDGLDTVIQIVKADCALITLARGHVFTREILNNDVGAIHVLSAEIYAANVESRSKSDYSKYGYAKHRGKPRAACPGWLIYRKDADREWYEIIKDAVPILVRIFVEAEHYSAARIAARLNADRVPVFPRWNYDTPDRHVWYDRYVSQVIRSRAVRGQLEKGEYEWQTYHEEIDGKRVEIKSFERKLTRQYIDQYPVIVEITEEMWQRANAALDARKTGRGPKGTNFANLFQGIAKCQCGGSMKLISTAKARRGRQDIKRYHYYKCYDAIRHVPECTNPRVYDYAAVEREFIAVFADIVTAYLTHAEPKDDPTVPIREQIADRMNQIRLLREREAVNNHALAALQSEGVGADVLSRMRENIGIDHKIAELTTEIDELQRKLEQAKALLPAREVAEATYRMIDDLAHVPAEELELLRSKINAQLKRFIYRIVFDAEGEMRIIFGRDGEPLQQRIFITEPPQRPVPFPDPPFATYYRIWFRDDGTVDREPLLLAILRLGMNRGAAQDVLHTAAREGKRRGSNKTPP